MTLHRILVLALFAALAAPAPAAFTLVTGTGSVTTSGTGTSTVATSGTGLVSTSNFLSWSVIGADGVNVGSNALGPFTTSSGTPIAAVYLVSNGVNPTLPGTPAVLPNNASSNIQRRTSPNSYSGDFSVGEPLLFANAAASGIIIDFATPVQAAGFRVEQDAASQRNDFFIQAYSGNSASGYSSVFSSLNNFIDSSSSGANTAPFFGVTGADNTETFTRIFIGFSGNGFSGPAIPFAISTLEVVPGGPPTPSDNAVPLPPTVFAGLAFLGVIRFRRGK